jgi:uncharacterized membrane protein YeaQ/YmgE (transglycosylase-associated protein family)
MGIIVSIIIGALAGFLAGRLMKGSGFGFVVNLLVGIIGGFLGGNILAWLGIHWAPLLWATSSPQLSAPACCCGLSPCSRKSEHRTLSTNELFS